MPTVPFIGISRHRLGRDGKGVTTLAAFQGCPLRCRYCINPQCHTTQCSQHNLTPQELVEELMIDNLYFLATGGGVTFGGGEAALRSKFIEEFSSLCNPQWMINIETSLNVPTEHIQRLMPIVSQYIIDIKDMNANIYKAYTGIDNSQVLENLRLLADNELQEKCTIRIPRIPGYNTDDDTEYSIKYLRRFGFQYFDIFDYIVNNSKGDARP